MAFLPVPFTLTLAGAFIALLGFVLLLNVFGLPANWFILGLVALWKMLCPVDGNLGIFFWAVMIGLAALGEILETGLQIIKARKYGSSSSGTFAGMIGAVVGAIMLAPLFWGLGAFLGALAGAWIGCFCVELLKGRPSHEALSAAWGATIGRFLGTVCKLGAGAAMIAFTCSAIWPDMPLPDDGELLPVSFAS